MVTNPVATLLRQIFLVKTLVSRFQLIIKTIRAESQYVYSFVSYTNNLHPRRHANPDSLIESIVDRIIPLRGLASLHSFVTCLFEVPQTHKEHGPKMRDDEGGNLQEGEGNFIKPTKTRFSASMTQGFSQSPNPSRTQST